MRELLNNGERLTNITHPLMTIPDPRRLPRVCYALLALSAVRLAYDTQRLPK
jgi:hypothetical protein